jgi:hypothetical protein
MSKDICELITARFIDQLKRGTVPWQKPWMGVQNIVSKKPYRGINALILGGSEFKSPYWLTFKQAHDLGGNVKKGEHATPVIYYKLFEKRDDQGNLILGNNGRPTRIPFIRWSNAFNLDQIEGIAPPAQNQVVVLARFFITQSPQWLMSKGKVAEAEKETRRLLQRTPPHPAEVDLIAVPDSEPEHERRKSKFSKLFKKKYRRATILASVPWFLQDLATYGIGIFTPTILVSILGHSNSQEQNLAGVIHNDMIAAKGAAFLDLLLLVGIIFAVFLADRFGRMKLQILGFYGCAIGLLLAALSTHMAPGTGQTALIFSGFMLFNFMTNLGPNAMTYLIAGEVFPTKIRGSGAGFAASFAKIGAVATAFLFPMLLSDIGTAPLLYALVGTCLGAFVTRKFQIETMGVNLEKMDQ